MPGQQGLRPVVNSRAGPVRLGTCPARWTLGEEQGDSGGTLTVRMNLAFARAAPFDTMKGAGCGTALHVACRPAGLEVVS